MIAVTASPGTANVSIGISAPPIHALLEDSLATIPSTAPSPKGTSGFFTRRFASLYAIKDATGPPAPGRAPTKRPIVDVYKESFQLFKISFRLTFVFSIARTFCSCFMLYTTESTSAKPKKPTSAGTVLTPPVRFWIPKVRRFVPINGSSPIMLITRPIITLIRPFA